MARLADEEDFLTALLASERIAEWLDCVSSAKSSAARCVRRALPLVCEFSPSHALCTGLAQEDGGCDAVGRLC